MAKKYTVPGIAYGHTPQHPERTARRSVGDFIRGIDTEFQVWPNRNSMARSIRMQQSRAANNRDWHACIPLTDGEGY